MNWVKKTTTWFYLQAEIDGHKIYEVFNPDGHLQ